MTGMFFDALFKGPKESRHFSIAFVMKCNE